MQYLIFTHGVRQVGTLLPRTIRISLYQMRALFSLIVHVCRMHCVSVRFRMLDLLYTRIVPCNLVADLRTFLTFPHVNRPLKECSHIHWAFYLLVNRLRRNPHSSTRPLSTVSTVSTPLYPLPQDIARKTSPTKYQNQMNANNIASFFHYFTTQSAVGIHQRRIYIYIDG